MDYGARFMLAQKLSKESPKEVSGKPAEGSDKPPKGKFWVYCRYFDEETGQVSSNRATDEDGKKVEFDDWASADKWVGEKSGRGSGAMNSYASLQIVDDTGTDCSDKPPSK